MFWNKRSWKILGIDNLWLELFTKILNFLVLPQKLKLFYFSVINRVELLFSPELQPRGVLSWYEILRSNTGG